MKKSWLFRFVGGGWNWRGMATVVVAFLVAAGGKTTALAGPIAPTDIPGLQVWYRVDQGLTLSGTQVSGWQDSSGLADSGRNMSQATAGNRPVLTSSSLFPYVSSVRFDGSNDYLQASDVEIHSNTTGLTVIGLVKPAAVTSGGITSGVLLGKFAAASGERAWRMGIDWFDVQESPGNAWNSNTNLVFPNSADPIANQWNIVIGSWLPGEPAKGYLVPFTGSSAFQEIDAGAASQAVSSIVNSTQALKIGSDQVAGYLNGDVVEIMAYNRVLTAAERQGLAQYLRQKYAPQTIAPAENIPLMVNINFEGVGTNASNSPLPAGYRIDNGASDTYHGNGIWSGWRLADGTPINVSSLGRNRNAGASPDERFDTLMHMFNSGQSPYVPYTWQLAVPNGTYWVRAVFGEPNTGTSTNNIYIQNTLFTDPDPALTADWDEYFGQFTVTDGRLTISPQPEAAAKICFMQLGSVIQPQIAINFEGVGANAHNQTLPAHYLIDSGAAFGDRGNGYRYGWVDPGTGNPLDNSANGRNRNSSASPDERYDTFNHLWNNGPHYNWEIELPNANYFVLAVFGEPAPTGWGTALDNVWIENVRFYDPDPNKAGEWDLFMGVVSVSDGRLTIADFGQSYAAKLAFIEITLVPEPSSFVLLAVGLGFSLGLWRFRRAKTA